MFQNPDGRLEVFAADADGRLGHLWQLEAGGAAPIVLNAANEVAVASFLAGNVRFSDITALVQQALNSADYDAPRSIGDVLEIDRATRERTGAIMKVSCI